MCSLNTHRSTVTLAVGEAAKKPKRTAYFLQHLLSGRQPQTKRTAYLQHLLPEKQPYSAQLLTVRTSTVVHVTVASTFPRGLAYSEPFLLTQEGSEPSCSPQPTTILGREPNCRRT